MKFKELTHKDAEINGYESVESFKSRLCEIYGELDEDQIMTIISWEFQFKMKLPAVSADRSDEKNKNI
jgi:hypothetical protein